MKINFIYLRSKISKDQRFIDSEKESFLSALNANKDFEFASDGSTMFFIETGGTEEEFISIYKQYKEPYIIVATNANNSLPASLEIASFLTKNKKKFFLLHGTPEELREQLKNPQKSNKNGTFAVNFKNKILNKKRYGVVGKPSNWLISSDVDYTKAKDLLGAELIDISFDEFTKEIDYAKLVIEPLVFKDLLSEKISEETLSGALRIYTALRNIIIKHNLNGLTVRCFDLLGKYENTSCLALALLNKDGYIGTCEGDVPAMLTMAIVREVFHQSSFQVNPSYISLEKGYGYFAHCTLPLDMTISYKFDTHFESGLGIGIAGKLNHGNVTIFKIDSSLSCFEVFEGHIVENLDKENLCRSQIKVQFKEDFSSLLSDPCGNHLIIFYGLHKDEILSLLK